MPKKRPYFPESTIPVPKNAAEFRQLAPAFRDPVMFPDVEIDFWLMVGKALLTCRWGQLMGAGLILFMEHNLALGAWINQMAGPGGIPGILTRGFVASEAAGGVSIGYDRLSFAEAGAGQWNLTLYGQRFYRLARMIGAGPVQLNVPPWGGVCADCGCGGMLNVLGWNSGIGFGPGWHSELYSDSNVPVGKFIPPRPYLQLAPPRGFFRNTETTEDGESYAEGDVLLNPETGERVQLRGDQWVFLNPDP